MEAGTTALPESDSFLTLERQLMISSDSPEIMSYIRAAFRRMRCGLPSANLPLDRGEIVVAPAARGLRFNDEPIELPAEQTATDAQLGWHGSTRLFKESFRRNHDWWALHAAAVRAGERATLLLGDSGSGKTTLTLALLARGAGFYSDEHVFLCRSHRAVWGCPRTVCVRYDTPRLIRHPGLLEACRPLGARRGPAGPIWDFIDVVEVFGPSVLVQPAALGTILLLMPTAPLPAPRLELVPAAFAALEAVRRLDTDRMDFARLSEVAGLLAGVPAYRVWAGPPAETAALLWERLQ
jgi:hypothetical protein